MSKFDECYGVSSSIIDKYSKLLNYFSNEEMKQKIVNELKELVILEHEIISSMSLEEINTYLEIIMANKTYDSSSVLIRVMNRMNEFKDVLQGKFITARDLGIYNEFSNIKFGIYDSILSMIDLNVIKCLKKKIDSLVISSDSDRNFVSLLYTKLNRSKIDFLFTASASEIVSLLNDTDIEKIPSINSNNIKQKINTFDGDNNNLKNLFDNIIIWYIKEVIKILSEIKAINNNPEDIYSYLVTITQFEVLISFLDRKNLCYVYNYCCNLVNSNNYVSMENVKRLIRENIIETDKK